MVHVRYQAAEGPQTLNHILAKLPSLFSGGVKSAGGLGTWNFAAVPPLLGCRVWNFRDVSKIVLVHERTTISVGRQRYQTSSWRYEALKLFTTNT